MVEFINRYNKEDLGLQEAYIVDVMTQYVAQG